MNEDDEICRLYPLLLGYVRRRVSDTSAVEDIVQEIFVSYVRNKHRVVDVAKYLFGAAYKQIASWYERPKEGQKDDSVASSEAASDYVVVRLENSIMIDHVEESFDEDVQVNEIIELCLSRLNENLRTAIRLRTFEGYTYQELATAMGVSLGTAHARFNEGLPRFTECVLAHLDYRGQ